MEHAAEHLLFIGTYTRTSSQGIYAARLDAATGALATPSVAAETADPTFLALAPDRERLYAVRSSPDRLAGFSVRAGEGRLTPLAPANPAAAIAPCHVALDHTGRVALATNYHTGEVASLAIGSGGVLGEPKLRQHRGHSVDPKRQASAHPHSANISPDNRFALVCDLGLDRIFSYRLDLERAALGPPDPPFAAIAAGSGPRHLVFSSDSCRAYAITEIANTLIAFDYNTADGSLAARQTVSTLPPGFAGTSSAAELQFHPSGRFLYASNRGHDSIALFSVGGDGQLAPVDFFPCGGKGPRHFTLSPGGRWLVCAHQDSDSLSSFAVDPVSARLTPTGSRISVPTPVCVLFQQ